MRGEAQKVDISVLIPTYFHERYIGQALDSVLAQKTDLKLEILVGDNASGDRTQEIVSEYANRYPTLIRPVLRPKSIDPTRNFMDLLRRAKGDYIAGLEGDDFWIDPYKLQKQWSFLEAHPDYIACYSKSLIVDENSQPDYNRAPDFVRNKKIFTIEDLVTYWKLPGQTATRMMRNIFRDMGPETYDIVWKAHAYVADKTMAILLLAHGPAYCSEEILSCYRCVDKKGAHNWFSVHHNNPYRNYDMFMYPARLETWARKTMDLPGNQHFGKQNPYRFCRFVEELVREPSLTRLKYLVEMVACSHQPAKYTWLILKSLIEME